MSDHEHTEPEQDERAEGVEDLDVPDRQQEGVSGGTYTTGSGGGDDRLTENVTLN